MKRMTSKKSASAHGSNSVGTKRLLFSSIFGACVGAAALFALFAVFTFITLSLDDPTSIVLPAALTALYLSAFASGLCAAKKNGERALLCSVTGGAMYFAVVWLIFALVSFISPDSETIANVVVLRLLVIPCALLGGLCALFISQSASKRPHTRKRY